MAWATNAWRAEGNAVNVRSLSGGLGLVEPADSEDDLTGAGAERERRGSVPTFSLTHTVQQEGWWETWESRKMMRSAKTSSHVCQFRPHVLSNVCGLLVMNACRPRELSGTIRPRLQRVRGPPSNVISCSTPVLSRFSRFRLHFPPWDRNRLVLSIIHRPTLTEFTFYVKHFLI